MKNNLFMSCMSHLLKTEEKNHPSILFSFIRLLANASLLAELSATCTKYAIISAFRSEKKNQNSHELLEEYACNTY